MPGYIIHLTEADMILKKISQFINITDGSGISKENWEKLFLYGSLLPDTLPKNQKSFSHFWKKEDAGKVVIVPELQAFIERYRTQLSCPEKSPLLCGYFAHLHLDYRFFRDYFRNCVSFLDSWGIETELLEVVENVLVKKQNKRISLRRFFSEEYLYGDYTKLNHKLIKKHQLKLPEYDEQLFYDGLNVSEAKGGDLKHLLDKMEIFVANSSSRKEDLCVFHSDSLELFLEDAAEELVKFIIGMK